MIDGESGEKTFKTLVKSQDEVRIKPDLFLNKVYMLIIIIDISGQSDLVKQYLFIRDISSKQIYLKHSLLEGYFQ